ncbi:hypothetical protein KCTC52924_00590 [Arenibacter antarcticus]
MILRVTTIREGITLLGGFKESVVDLRKYEFGCSFTLLQLKGLGRNL